LAVPRPQEGGCEIFWLPLTTASAQCLRLSERFLLRDADTSMHNAYLLRQRGWLGGWLSLTAGIVSKRRLNLS